MRRIPGFVIAAVAATAVLAAPNLAQQAATAVPAKDNLARDAKYALMSLIPAGEFLMGREDNKYDLLNKFPRDKDDDRPVHKVWVDGYYMDRFEVTNLEFYRFAVATGREKPWHWVDGEFVHGTVAKPVYNVTWDDAAAYCQWMGKRLPTEAEWEKAARGGLELMFYPFGGKAFFRSNNRPADDDDAATGDDEENQKKVDNAFDKFKGNPVVERDVYRAKEKVERPPAVFDAAFGPEVIGTQKPNQFGLYDIVGNVWEWTADWWGLIYYRESPYENPKGPETGMNRVLRGGSWVDDSEYVTVWFRNHAPAETRSPAIGFRCACDAPPELRRPLGATP